MTDTSQETPHHIVSLAPLVPVPTPALRIKSDRRNYRVRATRSKAK